MAGKMRCESDLVPIWLSADRRAFVAAVKCVNAGAGESARAGDRLKGYKVGTAKKHPVCILLYELGRLASRRPGRWSGDGKDITNLPRDCDENKSKVQSARRVYG